MDYFITGEESQTLQIVLQPGRKLTVDMSSICWCDSNIGLHSRSLLVGSLFSNHLSLGNVMNESTRSSILCLNQTGNGKVLVIQINNAERQR